MTGRQCAAAAVAIWALAAVPAAAMPNDRRVFEKLRYGQSIAQVQKQYPKMRKLNREEFGAATAYSPFIQRFHQLDVKVSGLPHPVSLELRFWKEQLWVVIVYFGGNSRDQIITMLTKRYGPPTATQPDPTWMGDQITVVTTPSQSWYSVNDNAISHEAQAAFVEELRRMQQRQQAPRPAVVAATPTPKP